MGANEAMPHPAGTSGQSLRVGSESSSEETEDQRGTAQKWQSGRFSDLGDSVQVWVPLDLQAVIPLPSSDLPHPGVLPSSPSPHHLARPQVSSSPFAYENHCALQVLSAAASACLNNCLCPAPARPLFWTRLQVLHVPPAPAGWSDRGLGGLGPCKQPGASASLWQILCHVFSP